MVEIMSGSLGGLLAFGLICLLFASILSAISATVKSTVTIGSNTVTDGATSPAISGKVLTQIDQDMAIGTNVLIANVGIDKDTLNVFYALATVDMTLKTNSSGSPDNTITLTAGIAMKWCLYDPSAGNPIVTADVTALSVTNATAGNLKLWALHGTP